VADRNLGRASGFFSIGTVVNVKDDPTQSGMVRVRWNVGGAAQDQIADTDLPWTKCLYHPANPSLGQVGGPHTGLLVGTQVMGCCVDGTGQDWMIMGTIVKAGTGDPDGQPTFDSDSPQPQKVQTNNGQSQPRYGDVNGVVTKSDSIITYGVNQGGTQQPALFADLPDSIGRANLGLAPSSVA
jgi:Gp5 N-terminal OB domain